MKFFAPSPSATISADESGARDGVGAGFAYRAFLSYSHADTKWAEWLMRRLEAYSVPRRFHGGPAPIGEIGPRIAPVFRDRDELPTASDLGETIRAALAASACLIVIASPAAAKSRWVNEEILLFKRLHGERRVFVFVVDGDPREGAADDCFPPALRIAIGPDGEPAGRTAEIIAADARPHADGREAAFVRLVAGLLGVGFDDLRRRELQRRYRRMTLVATASACGMAVTLTLAALAWRARDDARRRNDQAEALLGFVVGDLRGPLAKLNKLELLDAVGEKAMAYFASLDPRDLTDHALRRQAEALRQIGENRNQQARYPEALQALQAAYASANTLAARHPRDGDVLFERGQAEYWMGYVLRRIGRTKETTEWMTRYRDTGAALVALNPAEPRWQEELASGHHNLAVLDADEERLDAARRGFLGELEMLARLAAAKPGDLELQFRIADANSWLGSVAEMNGDLAEAAARYSEQVARTESILAAEPGNATSKRRLADALALHAGLLGNTGQRAKSMELRQRAIELLEPLAAADPRNQSWQRLLLWWRLRAAEILRANGELAAAAALADSLREKLEQAVAAEAKDLRLSDRLAAVCRLQAELRLAQGQEGADAAAARAVVIAERLLKTRQSFSTVSEGAWAYLTAGRVARARGDEVAAERHGRRALELLEPRLKDSQHWRILFPAAHAHALLGQIEPSRVLVERLQRLGFQPLEPWPVLPAPAL